MSLSVSKLVRRDWPHLPIAAFAPPSLECVPPRRHVAGRTASKNVRMSDAKILVTAALPYANGPIHLGHLVEYIQTDIWVRFQKLRGRRCIYICADDTHGTAIMIRAQQEKRSEESLIADMRQQHLRDFTQFYIAFDNYGSTHSPKTEHCAANSGPRCGRPR